MFDFLQKKFFDGFKEIILLCFIVVFVGCSLMDQDRHTIEVWHWMADRQEAFEILAKQYQEQTGISVQFKLITPSNVYTQDIKKAFIRKNLPDIYGVLNSKEFFAQLIHHGWVLDLTDAFQSDSAFWEKSFFPRTIDMNRFIENNRYDVKPGIYGVPLDMGGIQLLYNRTLLQEAGIFELPKTFEEWLMVIEALSEKGITSFVVGFRDVWLMECFALSYAFNIMGEEKVFDTFLGKVPYTDEDWIKVFNIFAILREKGVFKLEMMNQDNHVAEKDFALEKAAFTFNGTWSIHVYRQLNHRLNFGVMALPVFNIDRPMISWGGAESSFVVNARSKQKQESVIFLKWLTAREQQAFLSEQLNILPANRGALVSLSEHLSSFAQSIDTSTHPHIWPIDEDRIVQEAFLKGLRSIIMGKNSPKEVAEKVQEIKNRKILKK